MSFPAAAPAYSILNTKVLILNRSYLPIHVTSVRRAFVLLYQGIARVVDPGYQTFDLSAWCERGLEETIRRNVDLLRMVQVNDFVVGTLSERRQD